jgi:hypothetical protein
MVVVWFYPNGGCLSDLLHLKENSKYYKLHHGETIDWTGFSVGNMKFSSPKNSFIIGYIVVVTGISGLLTGAEGGVGESTVITLSFPFGARSAGMGEVGTALADDPSVLFFNPAGLGVADNTWMNRAVSWSFEYLLPAFRLSELWHTAASGYLQLPGTLGALGVFWNYINMGRNTIYDALGNEQMDVNSYEMVGAFGWGFSLEEFGDPTRHFGITAKPLVSALAPGIGPGGEGVAQSFAIDAGYLRVFDNGIRYGFTFMNMGPDVYYIDHASRDPIPFTVAAAVAWKQRWVKWRAEVFRIATELRAHKELVVNHFDDRSPEPFYKAMLTDWFNEPFAYELQEINLNYGIELGWMNTVFYRQGILFDYIGTRFEMHFGVGVHLFNHLRADFSWIYSPPGYMQYTLQAFGDRGAEGSTGARDYQWHISVSLDGLGAWSEDDLRWWIVDRGRRRR